MSRCVRFAIVLAIACGILVSASNIAFGQLPNNPFGGLGGGGPVNPPAYSPYLNLLNRGQSAGANYYGLVRPQMELRGAYQGLQQQINAQQIAQQQFDQRGLPYTGHAATFMNYRGYFLTNTPAIGQRSGVGQGQQLARPQGPSQGAAGQGSPGQAGGGVPR
jgi:hypothetical protein